MFPTFAATDPIAQFEVKRIFEIENVLGRYDLSFTNASAYMVLGVTFVAGLFWYSASRTSLVPNRIQSLGEIGYEFVADMIRGVAGEEGLRFFPFVFTLFFFILAANMIGMVPYAFTTTSHIVVTGALALLVIGIVIVYGLMKNGLGFFKLFAPSGAPWWIYLLLIPIEIISFLARPLTLALRLFANMLAGHIMLKLFAGFAVSLLGAGAVYIPIAALSFGMGVALNALEFLVAFLQAYVFAILTCVYLNDALHPAH
ncbi:MAG: F0F1 ATP synthase subunit A [Pseudomonadota bacterium]